MSGVNKAIIVGNLGRDPETRETRSGTVVCNFSVATSSKRQGEEQTEWHRVVTFGDVAEACSKYLSKGRQVYVEGRIQTRSYEKDGEKRYATEIVAASVQFLGGNDGQRAPKDTRDAYQAQDDEHDGIPF